MHQRIVNCVLSSRSLGYSRACLESLLRNSAIPIKLRLITDDRADVVALSNALGFELAAYGHEVEVFSKADVDQRAARRWHDYPAIREFRAGHPCWRKITDPELFAHAGEEVLTIDPDVYFPNPFSFEPTPSAGLMLMWQQPNCLLPEALVEQAFALQIPLADHTDIGVCQYRAPLPLDYLEQILSQLPTTAYRSSMHVESIIWAALAMHMGGCFLDPQSWHCFQNSVSGRVRRKFGEDPVAQLRRLDFAGMKAFHAGGVAKNWITAAEALDLFSAQGEQASSRAPAVKLYERYAISKFNRKLRLREVAERAGVYRLLAQ